MINDKPKNSPCFIDHWKLIEPLSTRKDGERVRFHSFLEMTYLQIVSVGKRENHDLHNVKIDRAKLDSLNVQQLNISY